MILSIHWVSITLHCSVLDGMEFWNRFLAKYLGGLEDLGHGGRGYRSIHIGLVGAKFYSDPVSLSAFGSHCHIELAGEACEALPVVVLLDLLSWLDCPHALEQTFGLVVSSYKITRIDLAFDNVPFTPAMLRCALEEGRFRSLVKQSAKSLNVWLSPWQVVEGRKELGASTVYFGSGSADRLVRCYDERGFTRFEFQVRADRAGVIVRDLLYRPVGEWLDVGRGHVRDFVDVEATWWKEFMKETARANVKVSSARVVSVAKLRRWLDKQVTPTFAAGYMLLGDSLISEMIERGKGRLSPALRVLVQNHPAGVMAVDGEGLAA